MSPSDPSEISDAPYATDELPSLSALRSEEDPRPSNIRHVSAPPLESPLRHHYKRTFNSRREVKETLNARSEYSNSEDDGTAEHRINQYLIKQEIGRGSFGSVHLAVDQFGHEFAVKEFSKSRLRKRAQSNLLRQAKAASTSRKQLLHPHSQHAGTGFNSPLHRPGSNAANASNSLDLIKEEIAVMKKLDHPNVVSLIEVLDDPTEDSLYMVLEMCKKGVVMKVGLDEKADPYDMETTRLWFRDMILGLEYLHAQGIIHRDIKPDNCLVTDKDILKIVDFGVSEIFSKDNTEMTTKKSAGSPAFMPPELCVVKHGEVSGRAADIWSMGVTLFCLVFGCIPFEKNVIVDLFDAIKTDEVPIPHDCDPQLKDLLTRLLDKDPSKRIDMDQIRDHPWVTLNGKDKLLPKEENTMNMVEMPTEAEVNAAITAPMRRMITVMKAAKNFKSLIQRHQSQMFEGMFGNGRIVQPPVPIEPHHVSRTQSEGIYNRQHVESTLATEGIHRDIKLRGDLTRAQHHVNAHDGQSEDIRIVSHSDKPPIKSGNVDHHEQRPQPVPQQEAVSKPTSEEIEESHDTVSRSEAGRGHAHNPLEDLLFLSIGASSEAVEQNPEDPPIVSESPGAVDINVYEKAYEEEIQKILDAKTKGHRPTLFLTKRVEGTKHLREHKDITDFSRAASAAGAALGFGKLAQTVKARVEAERHKADDVDAEDEPEKEEQASL